MPIQSHRRPGEAARFGHIEPPNDELIVEISDIFKGTVVGDISLFLEHYKVLFPAKGMPIMEVKNDERYCLLTMKAKLLTVDEYAKLHRIEHVTAVTRIRRGKLRSAVKFGKEWRISLPP